jgi:methionine sulfoxide reductase heme-binding subunit
VSGPRLVGLIALAIAAMCGAIVATAPDGVTGSLAVVRWTARTSAVLFALAYVARPAVQLWPSPGSKALLARRKWIGLGFATSHAFHLAGLIGFFAFDPDGFVSSLSVASYVGMVGFALIAAMAITSVEAVKRRMAKRTWTALHRTGMHSFWVVFAATYAGRVGAAPVYAVPLAIFVAIAAVRCAAFVRSRRRAAARMPAAA